MPSAISASFSKSKRRFDFEGNKKCLTDSGKTRNKSKMHTVHRIYMSDFAGLSVPKLKNLFSQITQLSSARDALYEQCYKKSSLFSAFFQLRRMQRKSPCHELRFSVILPEPDRKM